MRALGASRNARARGLSRRGSLLRCCRRGCSASCLGRVMATGAVRLLGATVHDLYVSSRPAPIELTAGTVALGLFVGIGVSLASAAVSRTRGVVGLPDRGDGPRRTRVCRASAQDPRSLDRGRARGDRRSCQLRSADRRQTILRLRGGTVDDWRVGVCHSSPGQRTDSHLLRTLAPHARSRGHAGVAQSGVFTAPHLGAGRCARPRQSR